MMKKRLSHNKAMRFIVVLITTSAITSSAFAARIKDIASLSGVRDNQLLGYGLVVGLAGSGDASGRTPFTEQSFTSMLRRLNIVLPANTRLDLKNVAAVAVSATLSPFMKEGQLIDVKVSSIGNAESLRGGTLLMTPLRGADDKIYAMAQGSLVVSGISARSRDRSSVMINIPSAGRIPGGATVERSVPMQYDHDGIARYNLFRPDFTTANRIVAVINRAIGSPIAAAEDAGTVRVRLPVGGGRSATVAFLSRLENLELKPGGAPAKVVVDAQTGTIVIGDHVRVSPAAVSHGNVSVTISENRNIVQPLPLSLGTTAVLNQPQIEISQQYSKAYLIKPGPSLEQVIDTINRVGASPADLVAILQALKEAGALHAQLVVI